MEKTRSNREAQSLLVPAALSFLATSQTRAAWTERVSETMLQPCQNSIPLMAKEHACLQGPVCAPSLVGTWWGCWELTRTNPGGWTGLLSLCVKWVPGAQVSS